MPENGGEKMVIIYFTYLFQVCWKWRDRLALLVCWLGLAGYASGGVTGSEGLVCKIPTAGSLRQDEVFRINGRLANQKAPLPFDWQHLESESSLMVDQTGRKGIVHATHNSNGKDVRHESILELTPIPLEALRRNLQSVFLNVVSAGEYNVSRKSGDPLSCSITFADLS